MCPSSSAPRAVPVCPRGDALVLTGKHGQDRTGVWHLWHLASAVWGLGQQRAEMERCPFLWLRCGSKSANGVRPARGSSILDCDFWLPSRRRLDRAVAFERSDGPLQNLRTVPSIWHASWRVSTLGDRSPCQSLCPSRFRAFALTVTRRTGTARMHGAATLLFSLCFAPFWCLVRVLLHEAMLGSPYLRGRF